MPSKQRLHAADTRDRFVTLFTAQVSGCSPIFVSAEPCLTLEGPQILDAEGDEFGHFQNDTWFTSDRRTPWLIFEGDTAVTFESALDRYQCQRIYPGLELLGRTLWTPERTILAVYDGKNRWLDAARFSWHSITLRRA